MVVVVMMMVKKDAQNVIAVCQEILIDLSLGSNWFQ
jgi:hypothetical protein